LNFSSAVYLQSRPRSGNFVLWGHVSNVP
jgi:hypothetical protein